MKKLLILAIAAVGLLACTGKNDPRDSATISCDPDTIVSGEAGGMFTVTISSKSEWSATASNSWITISPNSGQGDAFVTINVAAGKKDEARVLFSNGESSATLIVKREAQTSTGDGLLSGKFSVSASKQVQFSQGNLQYQASTQTWRFAEKQYDIIGSDNSNIANNYSGWIDLFGWGTGNNPTSSSRDYNDYSTFVDWGVNAISNGGNEANLWRTLTKDEWVYLFYTRTNAANLFGLGSVTGVNGTIILPDNWTTSQGASFTPSTTQGLADQGSYYYNSNGDNFTHNTYTVEQWSVMEQSGAVFLPAAGYRNGSDVGNVGSGGGYLSSTPYGTSYAYDLSFNSYGLDPRSSGNRLFGFSVRLVR